jgi:hypothetical protein
MLDKSKKEHPAYKSFLWRPLLDPLGDVHKNVDQSQFLATLIHKKPCFM